MSEASSDENREEDYRITALPRAHRTWLTDEDRELDRIAALAAELRDMPLLPCDPDDPTGTKDFDDVARLDAGVRLPYCHCAFKGCTAQFVSGYHGDPPRCVAPEKWLGNHFRAKHRQIFLRCCGEQVHSKNEYLDYYEEAVKVKFRAQMQIASLAQDRRTLEHLGHAYSDATIHCYMCFICAEKHLHIGGCDRYGEPSYYKGGIEYQKVGRVMRAIEDNDAKWDENFDFDVWLQRYGPRISRATTSVSGSCDGRTSKEPEHGYVEGSWEWKRTVNCVNYGDAVQEKNALCCPEDVRRHRWKCKHPERVLCPNCEIPVCLECWSRLKHRVGFRIPAAMTNDNFQGYAHAFIVLNKVRWIEAVTACPFFTCLVTYYVEGKPKERHHTADVELGGQERAIGIRGNVYSYMLPWESILMNAAKMTSDAVFETWPHPPDVVAHMIRFLFLSTSDEQCMAYLKELHVRSHVLVGLGRIYAEHLHEVVAGTRTAGMLQDRAATVARYMANVERYYPESRYGSEEGWLSDEVLAAARESAKRARMDASTSQFEHKNANPENATTQDPSKVFDTVRPVNVAQDSNAGLIINNDLQVASALKNFSEYRVQLQPGMMNESFAPRYNSLVSPETFNYNSGGPEYPQFYSDAPAERWRRHERAAYLNPQRYCRNIARNCLMQMSNNWTTLPIARNLAVRYEALKNAYMMVGRRRATGTPLAETATCFLNAAEKLFDRLDSGVCTIHQKRRPINGNVEMLQWADDLTQDERELLDLYKRVTGRISGAQGIRREFNYMNTGLRVEYGDLIFFTVTPDRRHSALLWRLMRARTNDTGLLADDAATRWRRRFAGADAPSLFRLAPDEIGETADVLFDYGKLGLPSVEEAIAMSARDPLSTVLHYDVAVRVLLAWVNGLRMCLHCPDCSKDNILLTKSMQSHVHMVPCQNKFGNNARIFGGTHGMAEALGAATENQGPFKRLRPTRRPPCCPKWCKRKYVLNNSVLQPCRRFSSPSFNNLSFWL